MRTNNGLTLNPSSVTSHHGVFSEIKDSLDQRNQSISDICEVALTRREVLAIIAGAACAALSLIFLSDAVKLYGWGAFLLLLAVVLCTAVVRKIAKGGRHE